MPASSWVRIVGQWCFRWAARSATVISSMPGALVALDLRQRLPSGYHARQPAPSTAQGAPGFRHQLAPPWLQSLRHSRSGLHPSPPCQRPVQLNLLPLGHGEVAALIATSCRSGLRCCHLLCPRLTSAPRTRDPLSPGSTAFTAHPPNLPPRPSMALDFAISCSLVRPGRPHIRFLSIGSVLSSFGPRLAAMPLRFASPSTASVWAEGFHLQAVEHARHTAKGAGDALAGPPGRLPSISIGVVGQAQPQLRRLPLRARRRDAVRRTSERARSGFHSMTRKLTRMPAPNRLKVAMTSRTRKLKGSIS